MQSEPPREPPAADQPYQTGPTAPPTQNWPGDSIAPEPAQRSLVIRRLPALIMIVTLAVGTLVYRIMVLGNLEQTSMMFIGLPLILAICLTLLPTSRTVTGSIMKAITLFLLMLGILQVEGMICILMAAPLFYFVGFIVGLIADRLRVRKDMNRMRAVMLLPLALMSLEGTTGWLSFGREEAVEVSFTTSLSPEEAEKRLADGPRLMLQDLPVFLKMGFPKPVAVHGGGLALNDTWAVHFSGGEGKPGDLCAKVATSEPGHYVVERTIDSSHISHWLDWKDAEWWIEPASGGGSTVHLTMRYTRLLDPAWYFKPFERYGVRKAGEYALEQLFNKPQP